MQQHQSQLKCMVQLQKPCCHFLQTPGTLCGTWQSDSELAQLWLDGKNKEHQEIHPHWVYQWSTYHRPGPKQDAYGGDFDIKQSFSGMITQVHMWNHVLSNSDIKNYMDGKQFTPGNVFNRGKLDYQVKRQIFCGGRACYVTGCKTVNLSPHSLKLSLY